MKLFKNHITIFLLLSILVNCNDKSTSPAMNSPDIPDDFPAFYESFHSDSAYQMEHILFPLDGRPAADTGKTMDDEFKWEKEDWKLHNFYHFDPVLYEVTRKVTDSTMVTETIREMKSGFGIKRRFAKFGDKWYLIYYDAMNPAE